MLAWDIFNPISYNMIVKNLEKLSNSVFSVKGLEMSKKMFRALKTLQAALKILITVLNCFFHILWSKVFLINFTEMYDALLILRHYLFILCFTMMQYIHCIILFLSGFWRYFEALWKVQISQSVYESVLPKTRNSCCENASNW